MKKRTFTGFLMLVLLLAAFAGPVYARAASAAAPQEQPQPTVESPSGEEEGPGDESGDEISFASLGLDGVRILEGPYDHFELDFNYPAGWQLATGARLEMDIMRNISSLVPAQGESSLEGILSGSLSVTLNDVMLDSIVLQGNGSQTLSLPLPDGLLSGHPAGGSQRLSIAWDAGASCDFNLASSVSILPASRFVLPHDTAPLAVDLTAFPAPLYLENAPGDAVTRIVVKDDASAAELTAALNAAAGLGRLSNAEMKLDLLAYSALSDEMKQSGHLLFIGLKEDFSVLDEISAPDAATGESGDGVIWQALSPWNPARVIIVAGGASDAAVIAAGRALSSGSLFSAGPQNDLVLVDSERAETGRADFPQDRTLADLFREDLTFDEAGTSRVAIPFEIPAGAQVSAEAYFDIVINHSQLIDYLQSGIVVRMNGSAIGSIRLSDSTSSLNTTRMIIPVSTLRNGTNRLELQVDIGPRSICSDPRQGSLWVTVFSDSVLHLPVSEQVFAVQAVRSPAEYPRPLNDNARLSDLVYALPPDDPSAWGAAARLAFDLGYRSGGASSEAVVVFSDSPEIETLQDVNLLVLGRPASLPARINQLLPVPFEQNELAAAARAALPFRVPQDADIGYIELAHFMPDESHVILAVLGSSDEGLEDAVTALLDEGQRRRLAGGNFAAVQGSRVAAENVGGRAQAESAAALQETPPESAEPEAEAAGAAATAPLPGQQRYVWIMPVLLVSLALILFIIGVQIRKSTRKSR